jgi:hypothetical protein
MAVTIVRTAWIDDDGTGTTGTVINNAVKTALYNDIDGALAKVAQLAGGNAFTGAQSVAGVLTASGTVQSLLVGTPGAVGTVGLAVATDATLVRPPMIVQNINATGTGILINFLNSAISSSGAIAQTSATSVTYSTTSDARLKDDAGRATDLSALRAVVVHDFAWKADGRSDRGVFAQEAHALFPNAILPGTDETTDEGSLARPWMTDYSKFVADLIVGWQQHDADLAELRALLAAEHG